MQILRVEVRAEEIVLEYSVAENLSESMRYSRADLGEGTDEEQVARAALKLKAVISLKNEAEKRSRHLLEIAQKAAAE